MSRSVRAPSTGRRSASQQAFRRLNHSVDHSHRNKRRALGLIATLIVLAAATAVVLALAPLFIR
ncbi:hypothetical protein ACX80E_01675 [Arthrobacter sp. TMN-49]